MGPVRAVRFVPCILAIGLVTALSPSLHAQASSQSPKTPASESRDTNLERHAWRVLKDGFESRKSSDKIDVIIALGTLGPEPAAIELLQRGLDDKDPDVRVAAASALGQIKARRAIPALRRELQDPEAQVSFAAARALWNLGDRTPRQLFIQVLQGERSASPGMIEAAKKHYLNPRTLAMTGVQEGAGALFGPLGFGIGAVRELAKDKGAPARALSAEMLSLDNSSQALRALQEASQDNNWAVRVATAEALGNSGRREAIHTLRLLLTDDKDPVRYMAAASIIRLETDQPPRVDIAKVPLPQRH